MLWLHAIGTIQSSFAFRLYGNIKSLQLMQNCASKGVKAVPAKIDTVSKGVV